ncbi:hypothetical protein CERSUDRAFT_100670 [Gelatoporia subvermispora B]|uniref:Uncharacterized protein n=1 Tax=Ceriporiopsis subvermispora (strain B) TaxID=914234 RepID=M2Q2T7_CERS8|nr:hypothetical protein CERSUDRAFT_100670 [Gelatoporia subvermispora B]
MSISARASAFRTRLAAPGSELPPSASSPAPRIRTLARTNTDAPANSARTLMPAPLRASCTACLPGFAPSPRASEPPPQHPASASAPPLSASAGAPAAAASRTTLPPARHAADGDGRMGAGAGRIGGRSAPSEKRAGASPPRAPVTQQWAEWFLWRGVRPRAARATRGMLLRARGFSPAHRVLPRAPWDAGAKWAFLRFFFLRRLVLGTFGHVEEASRGLGLTWVGAAQRTRPSVRQATPDDGGESPGLHMPIASTPSAECAPG